MGQVRIKDRVIGEGQPAYIVAEMSGNHAGSLERAKEIIRVAKECGADCVKIQTYTPDTITIDCDNEYFQIEDGTWKGENLYQLYGKAYTPWEWQKELKEEADRVGIDFFSAPFDKTAVDFLEEIGMEFYKIASFELVDLPLIRYTAAKGKPMILSTGMSSLAEIEEAVAAVRSTGNQNLILLRCASAYPAITDEMNLAVMADMGERFGVPVGLSDHSAGSLAAVTAVAMGACVIEKHLCLGKEIENPDASFSMEPAEFAAMVRDVRQAQKAIGVVHYGATKQEKENRIFRKSIFVVRDIPRGEVFSEENIRVIRPGYGLHSREYDNVLGKKSLVDLKRGTPLKAEAVERYLELVPAEAEHASLLYAWANDATTRQQSFSTEAIPWKVHENWYFNSLERRDRKLYICRHEQEPIGMFRLDFISGTDAEISYSIDKTVRHRGYGREMIREGERLTAGAFPDIRVLCAKVKPGNEASCRIFEELGYEKEEADSYLVYRKGLKR